MDPLSIELVAEEDAPAGIFTQVATRTLRPQDRPRPSSSVIFQENGQRAVRIEKGKRYRLELRWD